MPMLKNIPKHRKLLDEVRDVMRLHHYSIHTERTYCDRIKRHIRYHDMISRQDLIDGEARVKQQIPACAGMTVLDEDSMAVAIVRRPRLVVPIRAGFPV